MKSINIFKTTLLVISCLLFNFKTFAQPNPGTPNENAGDHPWTNNGNNGNNRNNGNNGSNGSENPISNNNKSVSNNLNVVVGEFYSLNLSKENATILLDTQEKFEAGSSSEEIQMTVFSSKKYIIEAQVSSEMFSGVAENTSVNTNNIDLIVNGNANNTNVNIIERNNKSLKTISDKIISSPSATKRDIYTLVYSIPAENTIAFLDQFGKTISTQIIYTLIPQ